ncbi:MAG: YHS domain-containing protein [Candidatus Omnitrophica bacterium]|nr:YHS domain-containing protein [Candidatus Omnitrophota bacterium]
MGSEAVNIGNKICPVSGEKINQDLKATYEYEGKIYNFCCAACIDEFKNDPEKYIKKVEEELKGDSTDTDGHMHEEHTH